MTANDLILREGHLGCPSAPPASRITRNTDAGVDYLEDGGDIDRSEWVWSPVAGPMYS